MQNGIKNVDRETMINWKRFKLSKIVFFIILFSQIIINNIYSLDYYYLAEQQFIANNYESSYNNLMKLYNENIKLNHVNFLLGKIYFKTDKYSKAVNHFNYCIKNSFKIKESYKYILKIHNIENNFIKLKTVYLKQHKEKLISKSFLNNKIIEIDIKEEQYNNFYIKEKNNFIKVLKKKQFNKKSIKYMKYTLRFSSILYTLNLYLKANENYFNYTYAKDVDTMNYYRDKVEKYNSSKILFTTISFVSFLF